MYWRGKKICDLWAEPSWFNPHVSDNSAELTEKTLRSRWHVSKIGRSVFHSAGSVGMIGILSGDGASRSFHWVRANEISAFLVFLCDVYALFEWWMVPRCRWTNWIDFVCSTLRLDAIDVKFKPFVSICIHSWPFVTIYVTIKIQVEFSYDLCSDYFRHEIPNLHTIAYG